MLVNEETKQLGLPFGTAEEAAKAVTDGKAAKAQAMAAMRAEPKPRSKEEAVSSATMRWESSATRHGEASTTAASRCGQ
jgi:hypothetical protein